MHRKAGKPESGQRKNIKGEETAGEDNGEEEVEEEEEKERDEGRTTENVRNV